jgi:hypothetical protein
MIDKTREMLSPKRFTLADLGLENFLEALRHNVSWIYAVKMAKEG